MKRSINEISGMVLKAGRGAGLPLGHCEDLALAAGYMAKTDPLSLDILPRALKAPFAAPRVDFQADITIVNGEQAVMVAPIVVDVLRAGHSVVSLADIDHPQIIFALCAACQIGVMHEFSGTKLTLSRSGEAAAPPSPSPATIAQSVWDALDALAQNTYVPATEASRLAGAGAGLTDND